MGIPLTDLEQAINFWRARRPSEGEEQRLCAEAAALAEPYALAILRHAREIDPAELGDAGRAAFDGWAASRN